MASVNAPTTTPTPPQTPDVSTAQQQQQNTANSTQQVSGDFTQFLTLLTTQLQNQDPLSPMDTSTFTQQLIGFSGIEQQINMNQKLDSLVALGVSNGLNSALGYVGLDVNYASSELNFDGQTPVNISYALNSAAAQNQIQVVDETSGNVVYQANGALATGQNTFTWDGSETNGGVAPAGTYTLKINAFDADSNPVTSTAIVSGHVKGVETQNGVINVLVGDRAVPIANILNATQPASAAAAATTTGGTG